MLKILISLFCVFDYVTKQYKSKTTTTSYSKICIQNKCSRIFKKKKNTLNFLFQSTLSLRNTNLHQSLCLHLNMFQPKKKHIIFKSYNNYRLHLIYEFHIRGGSVNMFLRTRYNNINKFL